MGDWFYEGYKRRMAAAEKRKEELRKGKVALVIGGVLLAVSLFMIPYHADNVGELSGAQLQEGDAYYIENLQILDVKVDDDDGDIYCVAGFRDKDEKEWIISFHPGSDENLVRRMELAASLGVDPNIITSGYVYLYELSGNPKIYYSSHSKNYAEPDEGNIIRLDADYLCDINGNYTLAVLFRPGQIRAAFVVGVIGIIYGIVLLLRNRVRREL